MIDDVIQHLVARDSLLAHLQLKPCRPDLSAGPPQEQQEQVNGGTHSDADSYSDGVVGQTKTQ